MHHRCISDSMTDSDAIVTESNYRIWVNEQSEGYQKVGLYPQNNEK